MNKILLVARWLLIMLIIGSAALAVMTGFRLWQAQQINAYISEPESFDVVPDDPRAHFAHANMLERQQEHDQALEALTRVLGEADADLLPLAYYNRGNINLREALKLTSSDGRQIPLVELAKQDYRSALALDPLMWSARYNLEVALRVVPEDPANNEDFEKNVISSQRSIESKAFKVDLP
ncbi:MxaK protein [Methylophaga sp. OBS1]|jgi:mxaK protein|uniref:MxaK protein n=1 Tax=Methylophaga sp. OBS1 TaxID=2991933 RepID=UPI0022523AC4|nr:MxaK protein [Methylophaga sp. OBS1]MCX4190922.1 MxaK protein [Methylophaga sp. OBS1]MCX4192132.1 MxaK protein [Methylophaga sp. OBS1]